LLAQVFVDGFRLCRRFHDYQSFCHILTIQRFNAAANAAGSCNCSFPV
jgi:hypothetical protein